MKENDIEYLRIKNPDGINENLIAGLNCNLMNLNNAFILSGHIDTVMADERAWNNSPYSLFESNNTLYGLGVADMKNFTANILANINYFKRIKIPTVLCLSSDEETTMNGIEAIISELKKLNIKPKYAIIGEPSNSSPCNCNKGFYEMEIVVKGKSSHSSNPENGINAIYIMSKIVTKLEEISKNLTQCTLNVGVITGGNLCNVVPNTCTLRYEMRTYQPSDVRNIDEMLDDFFTSLKKEYNGSNIINNLIFEIPVFEKRQNNFTAKVEKYLNLSSQSFPASTEAGFYQKLGADVIIFGVGDLNYAHSANEQISKSEFDAYTKKLLDIIKLFDK